MRTAGDGYFHETAFYGSDDDFLAMVVPFLEAGLRAGEPTLVACTPHNTGLLRGALDRRDAVTFVPGGDQYTRPADSIAKYRDIFGRHAAAGAAQIRVVGDVPRAPWDWWARYEAAANQVFAEFPLWGLCPYDTRSTPADVLADVVRTHPHIATAAGTHVANPGYRSGPHRATPHRDVLEQGPPLVELVDPAPTVVRAAVSAAITSTRLTADAVHDVVYAASELVSNGLRHGVAPVRFRLWADSTRVALAVTDGGAGPADPLVGLVPTLATESAGLGLWMLHRTCDSVSLGHDDEGFTVRVVVG